MGKASLLERSLKDLRERGFTAVKVEHFNHFAHVRQDLFGIFDILAIKPQGSNMLFPAPGRIVGVQVTDHSHYAAHKTKLVTHPNTRTWLSAGGLIELHSWKKLDKYWVLRNEPITETSLDSSEKEFDQD